MKGDWMLAHVAVNHWNVRLSLVSNWVEHFRINLTAVCRKQLQDIKPRVSVHIRDCMLNLKSQAYKRN